MHQQVLSSPISSSGGFQLHDALSALACPFLGEIYPPALNISRTSTWQDTIVELTNIITELPSVRVNTSSFAVQVVSLDNTSPIFEYYHTIPDHLYGETDDAQIDGDAVFRIASTSKMLAVYALLLECDFKCFEDPITKYMPELKDRYHGDENTQMNWEEVRIGALASHMAGIGRDYALGDLIFSPIAAGFGLPHVEQINGSSVPKCGANWALPSCDREETVDLLLQTLPIFPTYHSPAYSNMAFQLLGYVIESITGQSFKDVMAKSVFKPLGMSQSSVSPPSNVSTVIRNPMDPLVDWDYGDAAPYGGIFSSTNDLASHAFAVLNSSQLTPSQTRRWLKPATHSSNLHLSFGMPWEITRQTGLTRQHTVDVYCKGGSMDTYTTEYCIVPDLQTGIVVNAIVKTGWPGTTAYELATAVRETIVKPLIEIQKQQAIAKFAGRYTHTTSEGLSSLLVTADDSIGLVIGEWMSNGVNVLNTLLGLGLTDGPVRLFPASLNSIKAGNGGAEKVGFRAVILNPRDSPYDGCVSWGTIDGLRFAGLPVDSFVFEVETDVNGITRAKSVNLPAYRATYKRV